MSEKDREREEGRGEEGGGGGSRVKRREIWRRQSERKRERGEAKQTEKRTLGQLAVINRQVQRCDA